MLHPVVVHLCRGQEQRVDNRPTVELDSRMLSPFSRHGPNPGRPPAIREAFINNYEMIRESWSGYSQRGLAVFAIDHQGVVARARLLQQRDRPTAAVVGRHSQTDIILPDDATISLRQLLIVLHPPEAGSDMRFRVMDLRTKRPFIGEDGRELRAVIVEGHCFVTCGRYALLMFSTDSDAMPWPDSPEDGWACIPERIFFDERDGNAARSQRHQPQHNGQVRANARKRAEGSTIRVVDGPSWFDAARLLDNSKPIAMRVETYTAARLLEFSREQLKQGILFGRYDRCDQKDLFGDGHISRVHAMLLDIEDRLYAIDTASTAGTMIDEQRFSVCPMRRGTDLSLGAYASITWCP